MKNPKGGSLKNVLLYRFYNRYLRAEESRGEKIHSGQSFHTTVIPVENISL